MEELVLEMLGKIAYQTHTGFSESQADKYFVREITPWNELAASSKKHWKRIAFAVIKAGSDLDCGDLD